MRIKVVCEQLHLDPGFPPCSFFTVAFLAANYFLTFLDMFTIQHQGRQQVELITGRYVDDDQLYVTLEQNGELYADLSVCLPGVSLEKVEFVFKTWSGSEGLLQAMLQAEKIEVVRFIEHPLGRLPVCRLLCDSRSSTDFAWIQFD